MVDGSHTGSERWRLERAGIINVYQYGNEVLDFAGGRLLLRGVNGSGKSTAMNMLLPFLLTARQRNIDAAQDQRGLLRSWMLDGRDDAQPVGYLWIEFRRGDDFFACGCGIKANRQADSVRTWWFATSKRPGIDFDLVEDNIALSAEVLRDRLGDDPVFRERDRREYRRLIEQRLFGGASLDQHIRLIDKVRSPRVGDRIDRDLPDDLMDALPHLSEKALSDAAAPLDDLEEHRRNVTTLERTVSALNGLLERYRAYCADDLRARSAEGRRLLREAQRCRRDEARFNAEADEASEQVQHVKARIDDEERRAGRLRSEISAIEESRAYQEGRELDALRDLVEQLRGDVAEAERQVERAAERVRGTAAELASAQQRSDGDLGRLNSSLSEAAQLAASGGLAQRPPSVLEVRRTEMADIDAAVPEHFDAAASVRRVDAVAAAVLQRREDVEVVHAAHARLDAAEQRLARAQHALDVAAGAYGQASERSAQQAELLAQARSEWIDDVEQWATESARLCGSARSETAVALDIADLEELSSEARSKRRVRLLADIDSAASRQQSLAARTEQRLEEVSEDARTQQAALDELMSRTEQPPPRLDWQSPAAYCLADVVDFAADLEADERARLEAALEASGLLSARPYGDDVIELATGDLVAIGAEPTARPLNSLLQVAVPAHLAGRVNERAVTRLLASVSCGTGVDASSNDGTVGDHDGSAGRPREFAAVGTDGSFRLGALAGRHAKAQAEHIGSAARLEALNRARAAAGHELQRLRDEEARLGGLLAIQRELLEELQAHRDAWPSGATLERTEGAVEAASVELAEAQQRRDVAAGETEQAERAATDTSDELHRAAMSVALPRDRVALREVVAVLAELDRHLAECRSGLTALQRAVSDWSRRAEQLGHDIAEHHEARRRLSGIDAERERQQARLDMLTKTVGITYEQVRNERDLLMSELCTLDESRPEVRRQHEQAVEARAERRAEAAAAGRAATAALRGCESFRVELEDVLTTRGYLAALENGEGCGTPTSGDSGTAGLAALLDGTERIAPPRDGETGPSPAAVVSADGIRQSLRQRREALGDGWDVHDFQPDPSRPLRIEVSGPLSANATLSEARQGAAAQLSQLAGLLDRKQQDALHELLQGLIATEIAQKMHGAGRMIDLMNRRLGSVSTAHRVGVRLRWRRSPELDETTSRLVELLAKLPDLRSPEESEAVRDALSERLAGAHASEPDASYRELISQSLDYKQWHDLDVMVTRPEAPESRLSRRTPLSEGEKKLVTYLPLFVAVAASHDAMAEMNAQPANGQPSVARFVLLDDAFAKVSADNHAALFGLLVDLDLDFIATSERLWGNHATLPEMSIIEIVRDSSLRTILLDRYSWQGQPVEQAVAP